MPLVRPTSLPVSQRYGGAAGAEPVGYYVNHTDGRPLKAYGTRFPGSIYKHDFHKGLDQYSGGVIGGTLVALQAGTVIQRAVDGTGSRFIRVQITGHPNSRYWYGHLSGFLVPLGAKVTQGQPIAKLGNSGLSTGPHVHTQLEFREKGSDGVTRWLAYDVARFCPPKSFRFGAGYRAAQIAAGNCDKEGYLFGGSHQYDDRIYPIRAISINSGSNVRKSADTSSDVLLLTTAATPATQINEVPGGEYTIGGVAGKMWAKVKLSINGVPTIGYVAKPLIKVV